MTERLYQSEPFRFEFAARVVRQVEQADGRAQVHLDRTCFYPTGGGQDHDTGMLNDAHVLDVFYDDSGDIVHLLDHAVSGDTVTGSVDAARRFDFMQHHSAQHLVSAILDRDLGLETQSSHISIDSPTTIDVPAADMDETRLLHLEVAANAVIWQDRPINSFVVSDEQLATLPFRRSPKVSGEIRVIEIEGLDYSACGGTHCTRTGMLGIVKLLRVERRGDKLRFYLVAGRRALALFQRTYSIATEAARLVNTNPEDLVAGLRRQGETLKSAQDELEKRREESLAWQARDIADNAEKLDSIRLATVTLRDWTPQQVRALAGWLQREPRLVALAAAYDGTRLTLTVTCGQDTGIRADDLIRRQLADIGGRGGGDARLAQGGGAVTEEQFAALFTRITEHVAALRRGK